MVRILLTKETVGQLPETCSTQSFHNFVNQSVKTNYSATSKMMEQLAGDPRRVNVVFQSSEKVL